MHSVPRDVTLPSLDTFFACIETPPPPVYVWEGFWGPLSPVFTRFALRVMKLRFVTTHVVGMMFACACAQCILHNRTSIWLSGGREGSPMFWPEIFAPASARRIYLQVPARHCACSAPTYKCLLGAVPARHLPTCACSALPRLPAKFSRTDT